MQLIQAVIRSEFADCTLVTIAHRLNTIVDADRILVRVGWDKVLGPIDDRGHCQVMDAGNVAEFDSPHALLSNAESLFSKLVEQVGWMCCVLAHEIHALVQTGERSAQQLRALAKEKSLARLAPASAEIDVQLSV
jgi:hypothetical protein